MAFCKPSARKPEKSMPSPSLQSSTCKRTFPGIFLVIMVSLLTPATGAGRPPPKGDRVMGLIARMEAAYAQVMVYQTEMEVSEYREGQAVETKRFLYTFRKPDNLRIDMKSPYPGMILIYPDKDGKVFIKPGGWAGILKPRLSPGSSLLRIGAGQRLDQTDLGLLIKNIVHSLTDRQRGKIKVSGQDDMEIVEVLAEDHFRAGVLTLYHFSIDKKRSLPVEVKESTPGGVLKRQVIFRNLRTSIAIPDSFFRIDGENPGDGRLDR
jgi:outer membrane lipoprotein-sorting protein